MNKLGLVGLVLLLQGCTSSDQHRNASLLQESSVRVVLPPYYNATENENAGRAMTELTGTALAQAGILPIFPEGPGSRTEDREPQSPLNEYLKKGKELRGTHLLLGTVHEYHYKTDLNGDPAVGITLRLLDIETGQTVWQGSSAKVGYAFASLTSTAQRAVKDLISKLPIINR